jgi:coproporphyrinogen III oxidase
MSARGQSAHQYFLKVQDRICEALAAADGAKVFRTDTWSHAEGGGGRSRVLEDGAVIEKGGVNVSCVEGTLSDAFGKDLPGRGSRFFATGISLIIHPRSPHAPTVHANFRFLERSDPAGGPGSAWFGGGADLTPWILYPDDARAFHATWKRACDRHAVMPYARAKKWCDEYFFLPHRGETRGIGGIFFDYLGLEGDPRGTPADLDLAERFVFDAADHFIEAYLPIFDRRKDTPGTAEERDWQLIRRGRYVEFNLVYDRGTIFGLKTGGRIESILVSLPNLVAWRYQHQPMPGYQAELVEALRAPRDWLTP